MPDIRDKQTKIEDYQGHDVPHDLKKWMGIFHPAYIWRIAKLAIISLFGGALVFVQNYFILQTLEVLNGGTADKYIQYVAGPWVPGHTPSALIVLLSLVLVTGFALSSTKAFQVMVAYHLRIASRNDLERVLLHNLLHQRQGFFSQHSTAEIVTRTSIDVFRVAWRRVWAIDGFWFLVLILGNLAFLATIGSLVFVLALALALSAIATGHYLSHLIKIADFDFLQSNDKVKSQLQGYLEASTEIQVSNLFKYVLSRFNQLFKPRERAFRRFTRFYVCLEFINAFLPILGVSAIALTLLWVARTSTENVAVIAVVLWAMPRLLTHAMQLVSIWLNLQLTKNSVDRLLAYRAPAVGSVSAEPRKIMLAGRGDAPSIVRLEGVGYEFRDADGKPIGGIKNVTEEFNSGVWTAIVGASGSGKSTLASLILGTLSPETGTIQISTATHSDSRVSVHMNGMSSLMPQRVVVLDESVRENIIFGAPDRLASAKGFDALDRELVERSGFADFCLRKALLLNPDSDIAAIIETHIEQLRAEVSIELTQAGFEIVPLTNDSTSPDRWLIELVMGSPLNKKLAADRIVKRSSPRNRWLRRLAATPEGSAMAEAGIALVLENLPLYQLTSYAKYCTYAPSPVDESIWSLRYKLAETVSEDEGRNKGSLESLRVALTASINELPESAAERFRTLFAKYAATRPCWLSQIEAAAFSDLKESLDGSRVNLGLTWRENLLFGFPVIHNSRQKTLLEQLLVSTIRDNAKYWHFIEQGLRYQVGNGGSRLSGGERQLIGLIRALIQRAPILILDEPTSAMDPRSTEIVAETLKWVKKDRVLLTITHDTNLLHKADEVLEVGDGRVQWRGPTGEYLKQGGENAL